MPSPTVATVATAPAATASHRRRVRAALGLGLCAAVALGACSSANPPTVAADKATQPAGTVTGTAAPSTTTTTASRAAGSTTVKELKTTTSLTVGTVARPPTSKGPSTTESSSAVHLPIEIEGSVDGSSPNGSGCTPPAGDSLPDGLWYGLVREVLPHEKSIALDLACYYTGEAASKAAGQTEPVENDVYVTNDNPKDYYLGFGDDTEVALLENGGASPEFQPVAFGVDPLMGVTTGVGDQFAVWVVIDDGKVVGIQQQFHP